MGIIETSKKRGYKIATWVLFGFGLFFLGLGGIFMISNVGKTKLSTQAFTVTSAGNVEMSNTPIPEFRMNVVNKETSFWINTTPAGATSQIFFGEPDNSIVEIRNPSGKAIDRAWPGQELILVLISDANTAYGFGLPTKIKISSNKQDAYLVVTIRWQPLSQLSTDINVVDKDAWGNPTNNIRTVISAGWYTANSCVLSTKLFIFKTLVTSGVSWGEISLEDADPRIRLGIPFHGEKEFAAPSGNSGIYIPPEVLESIKYSGKSNTYKFLITIEYAGQKHTENFNLTITP